MFTLQKLFGFGNQSNNAAKDTINWSYESLPEMADQRRMAQGKPSGDESSEESSQDELTVYKSTSNTRMDDSAYSD